MSSYVAQELAPITTPSAGAAALAGQRLAAAASALHKRLGEQVELVLLVVENDLTLVHTSEVQLGVEQVRADVATAIREDRDPVEFRHS
jgi:hypothetical protein